MTDDTLVTREVESLGAELRKKRLRLGLSLRGLEKESGVDQASIHRLEQGKTPSLRTYLHVVDWIWRRSKPSQRSNKP